MAGWRSPPMRAARAQEGSIPGNWCPIFRAAHRFTRLVLGGQRIEVALRFSADRGRFSSILTQLGPNFGEDLVPLHGTRTNKVVVKLLLGSAQTTGSR